MELVLFNMEYLPKAAELLASRHKLERQFLPELPEKFEHSENAIKAVEELWKKENSSGYAVFKGDIMVGYMIGTVKTDALRERHAWIDYAGLAIAEGEDPELYRYLYAMLADKWIKNGYFNHYVLLPSANPMVVDAWFRLGFGHEQVHGLMELTKFDDIENNDIEIRLAKKPDREAIENIFDLIITYQAGSPCWGIGLPEDVREIRAGYSELVADEELSLWLAFKENRLVGFQGFWPIEANDTNMMVPDKCVELGIGGTREEVRGLGIGTKLSRKGLFYAKEARYKYCLIDWRMTNLLSSKFWPKQGFKPIAYRLNRRIDSRIVWANGRE